jgi:hypothetical protein
MKKSILTIALATMAALGGCVSWTDPGQLAGRNGDDLCSAYWLFGANSGPGFHYPERQRAIRAEIDRRGAIAAGDWEAVDQGRTRIGMSPCAVLAAWGDPIHVNNTTTASGTTSQLVYYDKGLPRYFVYIKNGKVTTIQN